MLESFIERKHVEKVENENGLSLKFISPGRRGVPDRIDLYPIPKHLQSVIAKYIQFTELKKPGGVVEAHQKREHKRLRKMGFLVNVKDHA